MTLYILPLFLGNLRGPELLIVVLAILLLFGAKKIPDMMRNIGKGVHSFKQGLNDAREEMNKPIESNDKNSDDKKAESK